MLHTGDASPVFSVRGLRRAFGDKSVLLRQLNGLDKPDAGSIRFHGEEITGLSEAELRSLRRRVAMLFQSGALFDSMTVLDNVAFPLREHTDLDEAAVRERVLQALERVGLDDVEDLLPASLSGGMKKRVALARSLVLAPEVVLYDEPTTGLDPMTSATIGRVVRTVQRQLEVTSMVVTHDIALARIVGDRVAFLDAGRFRFLGTWQQADRTDDRLFADFLAGREESHAA